MAEVGDPNPPEGNTTQEVTSDPQEADPGNVQLEETAGDEQLEETVDDVQPPDAPEVEADVQVAEAPEPDVQVHDVRGDVPLVLITGATGFIGMHILNELLEAGEYRVRPVVRDAAGEKQLAAVHPNARYPAEIVKGNIWGNGGFAGLLDGCSYIIHVTNPTLVLVSRKLPEADIIKKSGDVTVNLLKSARAVGTIKRIVMTCSLNAITGNNMNLTNKVFTENDWPSDEDQHFFTKCGIQVEKEAWKYVRSFPEGKCFEMAMVHPAVVMGPLLSKEVSGRRLAMHRQLLEHKINRVPNVNMPLVDVRDVALAHISALTAKGAADHRHLLVAESIWFTSTARILSEEFSKHGYDVPTKKASYISLWLSGRFDPKKRRLLTTINREFKLDNTRMKKVLGVVPRSPATTLIDMGYSMIDQGVVKKMPNYSGRATEASSSCGNII